MSASLRALVVLACGEALLARVTSGALHVDELALAIVVWAGLGAVASWRRAWHGPIGGGATLLIAMSIAVPPALERGVYDAATAAAGVILAVAFGALLLGLGPVGLAAWSLITSAVIGTLMDPHGMVWWALLAWAAAVVTFARTLRRDRGPLIVPLVVLAACLTDNPAFTRGDARPDIVLITVDALRADVGESFDSYARLATQGRAYEGWAASSWTLPSLASTMTGQPAWATGAGHDHGTFTPLAKDLPTLAERLRARGWRTIAYAAGNPFTGPRYGLLRGFDELWHPWEPVASPLPRMRSPYAAARPLFSRLLSRAEPPDDAGAMVDRAIARLSRDEGPRFLWLHLMDVHLPYDHPTCKPEILGAPGARGRLIDFAWWRTAAGRACLRQAYTNAAKPVDKAIGRLLDALDPAHTVIVFTADHGEALGDAGLEHGHTLAPEVTRVPLAIRAPRPLPMVSGPASLTDVAATVEALAGLRPDLPGIDLTRSKGVGMTTLSGTLYGPPRMAIVDGPWMLDDVGGHPRLLRWADPARDDLSAMEPAVAMKLAAWLGLPEQAP